jgi:hypothetical protein
MELSFLQRAPRISALAAVLLAACGDDDSPASPETDAGNQVDAGQGGNEDAGTGSDQFVTGPVASCSGDACPFGACAREASDGEVACSAVYSGPLDESSILCNPAKQGRYCVIVTSDMGTTYAGDEAFVVTCSQGQAAVEECDRGCHTSPSGDGYDCS